MRVLGRTARTVAAVSVLVGIATAAPVAALVGVDEVVTVAPTTTTTTTLPVAPIGGATITDLTDAIDPTLESVDNTTDVIDDIGAFTTTTTSPPPGASDGDGDVPATGPDRSSDSDATASPVSPQPVGGAPSPQRIATAITSLPVTPAVAGSEDLAPVSAPLAGVSPALTTAGPLAGTTASPARVPRAIQPDGGRTDTGAGAAIVRVGTRSTAALVDALRGLGLRPAVVARVIAPFPVAGAATYDDDDFGALRPGRGAATRPHTGVDLFAAKGTPVVASGDGVITTSAGGAAGNSARLVTRGGTFFSYAHLDAFGPGIEDGARVERGDVIGFVGTSGDADRTAPHLHLEIHPRGGAAVDPTPHLDRWLGDAEAKLAALQRRGVQATKGTSPSARPAAAAPDLTFREAASATPVDDWTAVLALAVVAFGAVARTVLRRRREPVQADDPRPGFLQL